MTTTAIPADYDAARELRSSDEYLDAPGTSVHLPTLAVETLLKARGWTLEPVGHGCFAYVLPGRLTRAQGGRAMDDYLWELDDALHLALTAEVAAAGGVGA